MHSGDRDQLLIWFQERGLSHLAANLLDAARPVTTILAQMMYLMDPLVHTARFNAEILGNLLEDPEQMEGFIADLREEDQHQ
ncbi:MAG: hypothetical protein JXA25_17165 [Anaerolineales bacterium]|nr:hypothetical protein [Anaerolineales bacterium]